MSMTAWRSPWLDWAPEGRISQNGPDGEPTKPTKPGSVGFVGDPKGAFREIEPPATGDPLKGRAVCVVTDATGERLWIVADDEDARLLGEPLGRVFTRDEAQILARIDDPDIVRQVVAFKRTFGVPMREPR